MNERGLTTVLKGIYAFVVKRIDALSGRVEKAQKSAENANSAAETAQTAADNAQQSANNANTNANSKVSSVNKKTGVVTLTATDVGAMATGNPTGTGTLSMNRASGTGIGAYSSTLGTGCTSTGIASHAEGNATTASKNYSHAEGNKTTASGSGSHAEGDSTTAGGSGSHAEGDSTTASGSCSHAEGGSTTASGSCSHAEGYITTALGSNQHVQGRGNIEDTENKYAHIVGNGTTVKRSNAHTLDWSGNGWYAGKVTAQGYEVEADGASHALAASDVGAISDTDGSVQNAHLADSAVTTDKLAEGERMTGANVVSALGYEPEEKSGEWELIEEITLTEDTAAVERTQEPDGTAYNFKGMAVTFRTPFKSSGYVNVRFSDDDLIGVYLRVNDSSASGRHAYSKAEVKQDAGYWRVCSWEYLNGYSGTNTSYVTDVRENAESYYAYSWPVSRYPQISCLHIWGNASWTMPTGTTIKIYGIRA